MYHAGGPTPLEQENLVANMGAATAILQDEQARSGNTVRDPAGPTSGLAIKQSQLNSLRKRHTFLNEYEDEVILHCPIDTLLKLESTSIKLKNLEKANDVDSKLTANRDNLPTTKLQVKEGEDNRWTVLHEARFLPGAGSSASKQWLRAREVMGREGHVAISTYDMGAVGLAGYVTPRGWYEIHDPGSSNLSLRQFSINNCGKKTSVKHGEYEEDLAEVVELGEFKCALRVLREAMSYVHPWNKSVAALEGFLIQSNYCTGDLEGLEKQASLLAQFVDYVLRENSNRWRGQESFLSIGDLKGTWESFFGGRPQSALAKAKKKDFGNKQQGTQQGRQGDSINDWRNQVAPHLWKEDICVLWNMGRCLKQNGACETKGGKKLRHVCNFRPQPNMRACGSNHASCFFHG